MRTELSQLRREVVLNWASIVEAADLHPHLVWRAKTSLPKVPKLLGSGTKTEKGKAAGIMTAVVYMAPSDAASPRNLCPMAGLCRKVCLGEKAGRMPMKSVAASRLWKTALYLGDRALWRRLVDAEARAFSARATAAGFRPAVRLDGCTDTGEGYEASLRADAQPTSSPLRDVMWYDYTKVIARVNTLAAMRRRGLPMANYHLTYSVSERTTARDIMIAREAGASIAVVVATPKGQPLPERVSLVCWRVEVTVDGDEHDARFLDAPGSVVGLRFKAAANIAGGRKTAGAFLAN